jgi:hypothetical protein
VEGSDRDISASSYSNKEGFHKASQCPGRGPNAVPSEYRAAVLNQRTATFSEIDEVTRSTGQRS